MWGGAAAEGQGAAQSVMCVGMVLVVQRYCTAKCVRGAGQGYVSTGIEEPQLTGELLVGVHGELAGTLHKLGKLCFFVANGFFNSKLSACAVSWKKVEYHMLCSCVNFNGHAHLPLWEIYACLPAAVGYAFLGSKRLCLVLHAQTHVAACRLHGWT